MPPPPGTDTFSSPNLSGLLSSHFNNLRPIHIPRHPSSPPPSPTQGQRWVYARDSAETSVFQPQHVLFDQSQPANTGATLTAGSWAQTLTHSGPQNCSLSEKNR